MSSASVALRDVAALAAGPLLVDPEVAGQFFGYGRAWTYELLRRGELPVRAHKIAGRFKIPVHGPGGLLDALGVTLADLVTLDPTAGLPEPVPSTTDPEDGSRDHISPAARPGPTLVRRHPEGQEHPRCGTGARHRAG